VVWLLALWLASLFVALTFWFGGLLGGLLAIVLYGAAAVGALLVVGLGLARAWERRTEGAKALLPAVFPPVFVMAGAATILPFIWSATILFDWSSFLLNRGDYLQIVHRLESGQEVPEANGVWSEVMGHDVVVDAGPPLRVAFPQPGGLLDNWNGIVYDPTAKVETAQGLSADGRFSASPKVRALFGGDIVKCSHIAGAFYRCSFT
jgi:hypothetical protein